MSPITPLLNDEEIVKLYQSRSESAIRETDRKYGGYLKGLATRIVGNADTAAECVNDAYLQVWQSIPPTEPRSFRGFAVTVLRRVAVNRFCADRRQKRVATELSASLDELEDILADTRDVESEWEQKQLARSIDAFVASLPKRRSFIFMARYYFGCPLADIAADCGCSLSTVNKEIAAIKKALHTHLESEGYTL